MGREGGQAQIGKDRRVGGGPFLVKRAQGEAAPAGLDSSGMG